MASEDKPRHPPMNPQTRRIEGAIEQAVQRGDFDDLPGAGKPLDLPATHDPDWWIKQRLAEDDVDRDALLPAVMLLRREHDALEDTLAAMPEEAAVREYAEDYTSRVLSDRVSNPMARQVAPTLDADEAVEIWRRLRAQKQAEREHGAAGATGGGTDADDDGGGRSFVARWWGRLSGRN